MRRTFVLISSLFLLAACTAAGSTENVDQIREEARHNPAGNNGTVKIQEVGNDLEVPENDPHVGCQLQIEFRGYDQGDLHANWTLAAQPPSGQDVVVTGPNDVFIGEDAAGGANDVDAVVVVDMSNYDLSKLVKHPQQGYHLKLTVHAEGSQGADVKHKVFWTNGCQVPPPPPPPPPSTDGGCEQGCEPPAPVCGDGNLDENEECDDGNVLSGDGCSSNCVTEPPPPPPTEPCNPDGSPCDDAGAS